MEPRKILQMNRFAEQKLRHRCREQTYGHQGGKAAGGGVGGVMNWVIGIDMYALMCIKWMIKDLLYKKINNIKFKNSKKNVFSVYVFKVAMHQSKSTVSVHLIVFCIIRIQGKRSSRTLVDHL